jgi:hypothetical protein
MRTTVAFVALFVGASSPAFGQTLEGVWKPVRVVVDSGPNRGRHTSDVQPGLMIFTKGYYSMTFVQGFKARAVPSDSASDEELGKSFLPFTANAGRYQRAGSTLTFTPSVAKNPAVMSGRSLKYVIRVKGDTMTGRAVGGGADWTWVRVERR